MNHAVELGVTKQNLADDLKAFDECVARAGDPCEGYWSVFTTLAWIATRDGRFVAATQDFEKRQHGHRAVHCAFVWMALDAKVQEWAQRTLPGALDDLRVELERDRLKGGRAKDDTGVEVLLQRHEWPSGGYRAFEDGGVILKPGYSFFEWPSDAVRGAFPEIATVSTRAAAKQQVPRRLNRKSGPKRIPHAIRTECRRLFKYSSSKMAALDTRSRTALVEALWSSPEVDGKELPPPSRGTVERYWSEWWAETH